MTYDVTMEAGGQSLTMASTVARTQAMHEDEAVWQIATTIESQMGTAVDTVSLRVSDLQPVHRALAQGPVKMTLDYSDTAVVGEVLMPGGSKTPLNVTLDGPVVGHLETAVEAMPLAVGFATQVVAFQPATGMQRIRVEVAGAESVDVPAGSFDAYRLTLSAAVGLSGTLWVTEAKPHRAVKSDLTQPLMGGRIVSVLAGME